MKSPKATRSAIAVVPNAMPTIAPLVIELPDEAIAADVCDADEIDDVGVAVADGDAVTVLVTTAFTRSKEVEFARPRVEESFCLTQPRLMKYLCPSIRPVA
jgi:hypothetical protein